MCVYIYGRELYVSISLFVLEPLLKISSQNSIIYLIIVWFKVLNLDDLLQCNAILMNFCVFSGEIEESRVHL